MPSILPASGTITLDDLYLAFTTTLPPVSGGTSALGSYYRNTNTNIPTGATAIPTSGAIALSNFYGVEGPSRFISIQTSSGTFTPPAGITKAYVIVVGGGGGGGAGATRSASGDVTRADFTGGTGGEGGLAIGTVTLTPGTPYTVTVGSGGAGGDTGAGGTGGTSSFIGLSATGGVGGGAALTLAAGAAGADGTASGGNILNGNVNNAGWATYLGSGASGWQTTTAFGTAQTTVRSSMSTLAAQAVTNNSNRVLTARTWSSTGTVRPGCGGTGEVGGDYSIAGNDVNTPSTPYDSPDASGGYNGAVIIIY